MSQLVRTDLEGNECPFCIENGLVSVLEETEAAYLTRVMKYVGGMWEVQVGRYFIIPKLHIESIMHRPHDWTKHETLLLFRAFRHAEADKKLIELMTGRDLEACLNTNWNNGPGAGGKVRHSHMWVIFRYDDLQVGMDGMIAEINDLRRKPPLILPPSYRTPIHEADDPSF